MSFEEYIMAAYSYLGKNIKGYGDVEAITIYNENHFDDRISFCFKDKDGWNEASAWGCMNSK